ncbi:hypothetical protein EZS27_041237 [termite gut metagenome]|uniref:DUF3408 domain-containing protein n=1 Tax=termite gut metagenome TaxID=433724 RepID=A0A5J4PCF2_9ZZZZ
MKKKKFIGVFAITEQGEASTQEYESVFLQKNELHTRHSAYVSGGVHTVVSEIAHTLDGKGVTLSGYIDNVLRKHLEAHRDEINKLYKRSRKDLV